MGASEAARGTMTGTMDVVTFVGIHVYRRFVVGVIWQEGGAVAPGHGL
jgi:hypothetical protein